MFLFPRDVYSQIFIHIYQKAATCDCININFLLSEKFRNCFSLLFINFKAQKGTGLLNSDRQLWLPTRELPFYSMEAEWIYTPNSYSVVFTLQLAVRQRGSTVITVRSCNSIP